MRIRKARAALQAPPIVKTRRRPAVAWVSERPNGIVCGVGKTVRSSSVLWLYAQESVRGWGDRHTGFEEVK